MKVKTPKVWHTPKSQIGMGDYHGTAIKNKVGRMREDSVNYTNINEKRFKIPPTKIA